MILEFERAVETIWHFSEPQMPKEDTFPGLERHLLYSREQAGRLLMTHRGIALRHDVDRPYFDFTDTGEAPLFEGPWVQGTTVKIGRVGSFSPSEIAEIIQELTFNYIDAGTMGKSFPKDNRKLINELLAIFIGDFDPSRIITVFRYEDERGRKPLANVQAHFGKSDVPLSAFLYPNGQHNSQIPQASLATLQAVRVANVDDELIHFASTYGELPERRVVCVSRLFNQPERTAQALGLDLTNFAWDGVALLSQGIVASKGESGVPPHLMIYDTHLKPIQRSLRKHFGMETVAGGPSLVPTDDVQETVLRYHYDPTLSGFSDLVLAHIPMAEYVANSQEYLRRQGKDFSLPIIGAYQQTHTDSQKFFPGFEHQPLDVQEAIWRSLTVESYAEKQVAHDLKPVIFKTNSEAGIQQFREFSKRAEPNAKPYRSGAKELLELAGKMDKVSTDAEAVTETLIRYLVEATAMPEAEVRSLVEANSITEDIAWLRKELADHGSSADIIESEANWIWDPIAQTLCYYIGPEAHRLLMRSRLIGLVPLKLIDKLKNLRIKGAGSSAVAHTLHLLVGMGAEFIHFYDDGRIDPSNIDRFPAWMGSYLHSGDSKAQTLQLMMQMMNPYGNYEGHVGKVVATENLKKGPEDATFAELADADMVFEVIDNIFGKVGLRLPENHPRVPMLWLADAGSNPIAGIEGMDKPFNQPLVLKDLQAMMQVKDIQGVLASVVHMLGEKMPADHTVQFLAVLAGLLPFWSQLPISAHESSAITLKQILSYLAGSEVVGVNATSQDSPRTLMPPYTEAQLLTLAEIVSKVFPLPTLTLQ